jgi:hypothetical protein
MTYTCPMHPEIVRDQPGRCPKCGMNLVPSGSTVTHRDDRGLGPITWKNYLPLIVILGLIAITSATILSRTGGDLRSFVGTFMIGFFLVFSGFKLLDLPGFAHGFSTYDLLAKKIPAYGYLYPFIELFFGLSMIVHGDARVILIAEILVMSFGGLGVAIKLQRKELFQCVCLGTSLKLPLTFVTLIENFGMAALALGLLLL